MSIFRDKIAIVTGAGSGIGKALGEDMARRGAHVIISDINSERIEEVAEGIKKSGGSVTSLTLNVVDYDAVKKMVDDAVSEHGRIDYIFNNAGIAVGGEARDVTIDDWNAVLDVNLHGVVNGVAATFPLMCKQGSGHIVNTASIEGLIPFPMTASYCATKYAVVGMSNSLRIEGADLGVKVSVVCPGYIKTRIFEDSKMVNLDREKMMANLPEGLGITPEECAKVILKGVEKNKAFIVVTTFAKILWIIHRISPHIIMWIMEKQIGRVREKIIKSIDP